MKKLEDTIYIDSKKIITSKLFSNIINFINENKIFIVVAYIIGTIGVFVRNYYIGLLFSPTNIIQSFIILFYMILLFVPYVILEYLYIKIINSFKRKKKEIYLLIPIIFIIFISCIVMSFVFMSITVAFSIVYICYFFLPFISIIINGDKDVWKLYLIIYFYILILSIPMQLGGLKEQKVIYMDYESNSNICYMYNYYGISDGLYQFKIGKKVIMIPVERGYISYLYTKRN